MCDDLVELCAREFEHFVNALFQQNRESGRTLCRAPAALAGSKNRRLLSLNDAPRARSRVGALAQRLAIRHF